MDNMLEFKLGLEGLRYAEQKCSISDLRAGDTVIHNGKITTVSNSNLKRGGFCGDTFCGDSYMLGQQKITRIFFPRSYRGVLLNGKFAD